MMFTLSKSTKEFQASLNQRRNAALDPVFGFRAALIIHRFDSTSS